MLLHIWVVLYEYTEHFTHTIFMKPLQQSYKNYYPHIATRDQRPKGFPETW